MPHDNEQRQQDNPLFQRMPRRTRDQHRHYDAGEQQQPWESGLARPRVRLAQVSLDEGMFGVLVRIDEALRTRQVVGDTETLNRIQELYRSRFHDFGL